MANERPRLSVCMIVKNEEDSLERCLRSVKDIADEIVVVDTGSDDDTVKIAESFSARVFHHPWQRDFALHRNQSIEYAEGDWILMIDADEELQSGHEALLEAIASTDKNTIAIPVVSDAPKGEFQSTHNSAKLLRASAGIRYIGAVHNEIDYTGPTQFVPARLYHYGYNLERDKMLAKFQRTTSLLLEQIDADPQNPKWPANLAVSYLTEEMFGECTIAAEHALGLIEQLPEEERGRWVGTYYMRAAAAFQMQDYVFAEQLCLMALEINPDYIDALAVLVSVYFVQEDNSKMVDAATRYLDLHSKFSKNPAAYGMVPIYTMNQKPQVMLRLAVSSWRDGDDMTATKYYEQAILSASDKIWSVLATADALWGVSLYDKSISILNVALEQFGDERELVDRLLTAYARLNKKDEAQILIDGLEHKGEALLALSMRGKLSMLSGDFEGAQGFYRKLLEIDTQNGPARVQMALALEGTGKREEAEKLYREAMELCDDAEDAGVHLGRLYTRSNETERAIEVLEGLLASNTRRYEALMMLCRLYIGKNEVEKLMDLIYKLTVMLGVEVESEIMESAADLAEVIGAIAAALEGNHELLATEEAWSLAAHLDSDKPDYLIGMARFLTKFGRGKDAVGLMENVLRKFPRSREAFEVLGLAYESTGAFEAAQLCRQKATELLEMN